jgi:hypothetical protein
MHIYFFFCFTVVMTSVILNLFVAVVLDGFDGSAVGEEEAIVQKCIEVWFRYDKNVNLILPIPAVKQLMEDIEVEFVMEMGWRPLPPSKNKLIKDARYYVHDFMHCAEGRVTFLNATLGSMLVLLCHARIHERNGKWSDLAIQEVKNNIQEIREVSTYAFVAPPKLPPGKEEQQKIIEQLKVETMKEIDDEQMKTGQNFRAHIAAMSMQEKFREKAVNRAQEARVRRTLKIQQEQEASGAEKEKAKVDTEDEQDESGNKMNSHDDYGEPGLPGGVDDNEEAEPQPLKPAVAG